MIPPNQKQSGQNLLPHIFIMEKLLQQNMVKFKFDRFSEPKSPKAQEYERKL